MNLQEAQQSPARINPKRPRLRHNVVKISKAKDRDT